MWTKVCTHNKSIESDYLTYVGKKWCLLIGLHFLLKSKIVHFSFEKTISSLFSSLDNEKQMYKTFDFLNLRTKKSAMILWGWYSLLNFFSSIWAFNDLEDNHSNFSMSSTAKPTKFSLHKCWISDLWQKKLHVAVVAHLKMAKSDPVAWKVDKRPCQIFQTYLAKFSAYRIATITIWLTWCVASVKRHWKGFEVSSSKRPITSKQIIGFIIALKFQKYNRCHYISKGTFKVVERIACKRLIFQDGLLTIIAHATRWHNSKKKPKKAIISSHDLIIWWFDKND